MAPVSRAAVLAALSLSLFVSCGDGGRAAVPTPTPVPVATPTPKPLTPAENDLIGLLEHLFRGLAAHHEL
jgi:hypothetical protein